MDTQLKQRLTGAVLLVVIAVLVVPELLTGPKTATPAAPVASDAAPIRSYTIDLTGATPPRVTRQPGDDAPPAAAPVAAAAAAAAAASAGPARAATSTAAPASATAAAAPSATSSPAPVAAVRPAGAPPAAAPPATATPPTASAAPQATAPVAAQGFAVQLGSYANRDTVAKLTKALRAGGFKVSVAQVRAGGKELQRVRVGPVADRAAAEALQSKLAAAGHKGPIVPFP